LKEAGKGSGEFSEAVYDGVLAGLQETEWRGEELSAKILILIGDNSAHDFGHKKNPQGIRPEELAKAAKEKGVRIFSLVVPGGGDRSERARHEQQFQFLAESTGGESLPLSDQSAQSVLESIRAIMKTEAATVHTRSVVFDGMAEGKSKEQIISQHSLNEKEFTAVMEFLNSAGIDPSRFQGGTAFATGWCVAAPGGLPVVEREVFIARSELEMLISELHRLCQNLGAEFGSNIARAGLTGRVDPRSWFGQADQGPFDLWLAAKGIPTSNGLLKLSRHQLDTMAEQTRGQLRDDILRHYIPGLMNLRNDNSRFTLIGNLEWGFVQESKLP
ncbi:MAG: hypothetical protein PF795_07035, partial [Kiritimatiellae bacterium]|nr:hypothetical protein [Kiritimatiellia bacterium]